MQAVWQSLILATVGTFFLRLGGRKSISEMTVIEVTVMITIGAILGSDVGGKGLKSSLVSVATFIAFMVVLEWVQLKWNRAEKLITGVSIPVILDGKVVPQNLGKLRMSVDNLEMRLRNAGISRIEDVKVATIEPNGILGYELAAHARPVTRGDMEQLLAKWIAQHQQPTIFEEVQKEQHQQPISEPLQ